MSKIFYDDLIDLSLIEREIRALALPKDEKEELWEIVDGIVSHKVINVVLTHLPRGKHEEFLDLFLKSPHEAKLVTYLKKNIQGNFEELIEQQLGGLAYEILQDLKRN